MVIGSSPIVRTKKCLLLKTFCFLFAWNSTTKMVLLVQEEKEHKDGSFETQRICLKQQTRNKTTFVSFVVILVCSFV